MPHRLTTKSDKGIAKEQNHSFSLNKQEHSSLVQLFILADDSRRIFEIASWFKCRNLPETPEKCLQEPAFNWATWVKDSKKKMGLLRNVADQVYIPPRTSVFANNRAVHHTNKCTFVIRVLWCIC